MDDYRTVSRLAWGPLMSEAALCARDLGLLATLRTHGALTPEQAHERTRLTLYAARILLEACSAAELVRFDGERYSLTTAGELYLSDDRVRVDTDFVHDVCYRGAFHLRESLTHGRPIGLRTLGGDWPTVYEALTRLPDNAQRSWFAFDHFYSDPLFANALHAMERAEVKTILDVGGNTGRFAVLAAKNHEVTVLDHPAQLGLTRRNAIRNEVRLQTQPIDLLDHSAPFPTDFDAVWMCQLLDCFAEADVTKLLERARGALSPKGKVWVVEPLWDRQPNDVARYCVQATSLYFACIANGTSRMYHSSDLLRCAKEAGLVLDEERKIGPFHTLMTFT